MGWNCTFGVALCGTQENEQWYTAPSPIPSLHGRRIFRLVRNQKSQQTSLSEWDHCNESEPTVYTPLHRKMCAQPRCIPAIRCTQVNGNHTEQLRNAMPYNVLSTAVYLFQSRNPLLLRRAIGCFAFPAHASVTSDHTPLITRTRYLPLIISYRPSFSLSWASGAPCQPVTTHLTHS